MCKTNCVRSCPLLPSGKSAQPERPDETLCEPLLERSESGRLQKAAAVLLLLRPLCKRLTQTTPPTNMSMTARPSQSSLIWQGLLWFSMLPWQHLMLKGSLSVQGEKWKGDLAVGEKHTGPGLQAGHQACHLVVKIAAGFQVGQVPSFPQLDSTLGDMLPASGLQVSLLLLPLSPLVQIPKSLSLW